MNGYSITQNEYPIAHNGYFSAPNENPIPHNTMMNSASDDTQNNKEK
jgi:hypothetical protein